ncbi:uncharacterized protein N7469_002785 [Penicillium citrinum]|uniref:HDA1 complex subunit n=2 Tax=Penicillium TaxID=5073 RepID=A0A9W9TVP0_PENCI|nr:uncharacterized protein N7469_002785 [Penicillium citrinum]KAJ5241194.1 hypothetical protein N7469_002785 [Penicillium citrinum]KAJ5586194.1 hypothetical protein N7450_005981 [Penicillium hetheringtonii]
MDDKQSKPFVDTPSSVGDIEPSVSEIPERTMPLSVRPDTESIAHAHTSIHHTHADSLLHASHYSLQGPMQTIQPSDLSVGNVEESAPGFINLGPSEFAITLPLDSRLKDEYDRVLGDATEDIRRFLVMSNPAAQISDNDRDYLISRMHEVVSRLNNVTLHPDLNIAHHLTFNDSKIDNEASWAEYSSSKFYFLGHLIEMASSHDIHIIIEVRGEMKQKLVERYLVGKGFTYSRPREEMGGNVEMSLVKGQLSFGIHSHEGVRDLIKSPSAILVLDTAFDPKNPAVQLRRTTFTRNNNLLPVIWLLVSNSCEHIERCLPNLPEADRLRLLLQYTAHLHDDVGDLQDNALGVLEDAEEVLIYLRDGLATWPLPIIEPLPVISPEDLESSTPSTDGQMPTSQKRSLDEDSEDYSSKRTRILDDSQLTEPTRPPTQTLGRDLQSLEKNIIQMQSTHATEKEQIMSELVRVSSRVQTLEKALSTLQHRYESRTKELHQVRQERDNTTESKVSLTQRVERQREDISKLKEERTQLRQELEESRQELKSGGGTLAELETAREEIRRLNKEHAGFERKAEYERNQAEYTREQYQNASTVAAQAGNELRQLRSENEALQRKVEANTAHLLQLNLKNDSEIHLARINELELTLAARDEMLQRKEEELRDIRKNRPSTRSTSTQPRSPKITANSRPTSPGVGYNGNGNGNGLAGRGSALRFSSETF